MGSWLPRIKFWYGWCGFIKFQCGSKKGRGSKFCMRDVDGVGQESIGEGVVGP